MLALSFLLSLHVICQNHNFYTALTFKRNIEINGLSNNPYKLITECFFNKSLSNEFLWGSTKVSSGYYFNVLNIEKNESRKIKIDIEKLKTHLSKKDYDDLIYYGFYTLLQTKKHTLFDVGNNIYLFNEHNDELLFDKKIHVPDSIDFNFTFANTDSSVILLDYRASFGPDNKIKTYRLNLNTHTLEKMFETDMGSNSSCFDRANTKFYDVTKNYFLITDNLDYKIYLFNNNTKKVTIYEKPLHISEISRQKLNPNNIEKNTLDSISKELDKTPRIINTQFINDSVIIVNYAIKPCIKKNGVKIKNSTIDILTIKNDSIIYKSTFNDDFYYEQIKFGRTHKINPTEINPHLRSELYYFALNNYLIKITFKQLIPKSNTSFEKYIRKAKSSILNLKSNLICHIYEFHP